MSRLTHPIFEGPVPVSLDLEDIPAPENFRDYRLAGPPLETVQTFLVHERSEPDPAVITEFQAAQKAGDMARLQELIKEMATAGVASSDAGFADSPDTESILGGINAKGPDYIAVGRQANFLLWGFAADPSTMTDAGRALFVNSLAYITEFAGERPLVLRHWSPRDSVAVTLAYLDSVPEEHRARSIEGTFGGECPEELLGEREARSAWFDMNRGFIRRTAPKRNGTYEIDADCREWGIANHDVALLDRCVAELRAGGDTDRATRLVRRYTNVEPSELEGWLTQHRDHLFFSDWAGYKFISAIDPPPLRPDLGQWRRESGVLADVAATRDANGAVTARLGGSIPAGSHLYGPTCTEGVPVSVALAPGSGFTVSGPVTTGDASADEGHLVGSIALQLPLQGDGDVLELDFTFQLCDAESCLRPTTLRLACEVV